MIPSWLAFDSMGMRFVGTPTFHVVNRPNADYLYLLPLLITASNGYKSASTLIQLNITEFAPKVSNPIPHRSFKALNPFTMELPADTFVDEDDAVAALEYEVKQLEDGSPLPSWLSYEPQRYLLKGTPPVGVMGQSYAMQVTAKDRYGKWASTLWRISIPTNHPPTAQDMRLSTKVATGQEWFWRLPLGTFSDPDNDPLSYAMQPIEGKALPGWLKFDETQAIFSGKPQKADLGSITLQVVARDPYGESAACRVSVQVERSLLDQILYILSFVGPAASALGVAYSLYLKRGLLKNLVHARYDSRNPRWVSPPATLPVKDRQGRPIPQKKVHTVQVLRQTRFTPIALGCLPLEWALPEYAIRKLKYTPVPTVGGGALGDQSVVYYAQANELRFNRSGEATDGPLLVQVLGTDGEVLNEWQPNPASAEGASELLPISTSAVSLDLTSMRDWHSEGSSVALSRPPH